MRDVLPRIEELPLWPKLAVPFFFFLFLALVYWTYKKERKSIYTEVEKLPLSDEGQNG